LTTNPKQRVGKAWNLRRSMGEANRDIVLPDSYQKAKRAALIYSALLIVFFFSNLNGTAKIPGLDVAVAAPVAIALVWIAAAYYTIIFHWEFVLARRLNSSLMIGRDFRRVDDRLREMANWFKNEMDRYRAQLESVSANAKAVSDQVEKWPPDIPKINGALVRDLEGWVSDIFPSKRGSLLMTGPVPPEHEHTAIERVAKTVIDSVQREFARMGNELKKSIDVLEKTTSQSAQEAAFVRETIEAYQGELKGLAKTVRWERRLLFYGLDAIPVWGLFVAATFLSGLVIGRHLGWVG
jgi:predicted DNA-binding protein